MNENINFENIPGTGRGELEDLEGVITPPTASKKLGIALVGLGKYSAEQLAPALQETKHCYLAGIVSGSEKKIKEWKLKYEIPDGNIYSYENFDTIKENKAIDILYIVLPNAMHAAYTIRGANCGKHIICEKPMAVTVEECDAMIRACREAGRMLSIGYRLHFDPHHRDMMKMGQAKIFGRLQKISATHGSGDTTGWRLDKALAGGGPLMDLGIYCIQAARYVTGLEPLSVTVTSGSPKNDQKFRNIEDHLVWEMEFPDGLTVFCETSYREEMNSLHADAEHGWFELSPAYSYEGIKGKTATGFMNLPQVNQQALQMDDFSLCIQTNKPSRVSGEMGKADLRIITAIYESMKTGQRIELGASFYNH